MAEFEVKIKKVSKVEDHPNADRLSLIYIDGFAVVSAKLDGSTHRYKEGDYVIYVPENAVVPERFLRLGFWDEAKGKGILAGSNGDRVKPLKLRGILSEGIIFPVVVGVWPGIREISFKVVGTDDHGMIPSIDTNLAEILGFKKYLAPIPTSMGGDVEHYDYPIKFDIENLKKTPDAIPLGSEVIITRKLHGTFCGFGFKDDGTAVVFSKGLGSQGLVFINNEVNAQKNVYVRILNQYRDKIEHKSFSRPGFYIMGEIIGRGIQDLHYGFETPVLRLFGTKYPRTEDMALMEFHEVLKTEFERVPVLYSGPWEPSLMKLADGYDEAGKHVHEGIVIMFGPGYKERLKVISDAYYTRKNGTEYN